MEILYVVLIIVAIFIALVAVAIIVGTSVVRRNRRLNKLKRLRQQPPVPPNPPIPDIVNFTSPGIVPVTAPEAIKSAANSIVTPVVPDGQTVRVRNTDDLNKYYVAGNDPFIEIFNDTLKDDVEHKLNNSNKGYAEVTFDDIIIEIINETTIDEGYIGDDDDLDSNPYERLLHVWKNNQPLHSGSIAHEIWSGGLYDFYLELNTRRNGENLDQALITIVYTPTFSNNNNGNILRYRAEYFYKDENKEDDTEYYNIDNLDQMIADMNARMPIS
jgi:hypothetical protein